MEPYNMYPMGPLATGPSRPPLPVGCVDPTPWELQSEVRMASTVIEPPSGFGCGVQTEVRMASTTINDHQYRVCGVETDLSVALECEVRYGWASRVGLSGWAVKCVWGGDGAQRDGRSCCVGGLP